MPKSIIDACTMRVGRYPSMKDGGCSWTGVICDTSPEEDHWWPIMSGEVPVPDHIGKEEAKMLIVPDNRVLSHSQPGMREQKNEDGDVDGYTQNEAAENKNNMRSDYYPNIVQGKTKSWIDVYVMNRLALSKMASPSILCLRQIFMQPRKRYQ